MTQELFFQIFPLIIAVAGALWIARYRMFLPEDLSKESIEKHGRWRWATKIATGSFFLTGIGFIAGFATTTQPTVFTDQRILWSLGIAIVLIAGVSGIICIRLVARGMADYLTLFHAHCEKEREVLAERVTCTDPLEGEDAVLNALTDVFNVAEKSRTPIVRIGVPGFNGRPETDLGDDTSPLSIYQAVYDRAMTSNHPIIQYIKLKTPQEFAIMSKEDQAAYKKWVLKQACNCDLNGSFVLFHTPEAFGYAAATSVVASNDTMVRVIGNGLSGERTRGRSFVEPNINQWKRMFEHGKILPTKYSSEKLRRYISEELDIPWIIRPLKNLEDILIVTTELLENILVSEQESHSFVDYDGTASLFLTDSASSERYRNTVEEIMRRNLPVRRFMRLMSKKEYQQRGLEIRKAYITWLEGQIKLLKQNPKYEFYNSMRAQGFTSTKSTIATSFGMIEVIGDGQSGMHMSGDDMYSSLRTATSELMFEKAANKPERLTQNRIRKYLDELKN